MMRCCTSEVQDPFGGRLNGEDLEEVKEFKYLESTILVGDEGKWKWKE